MPPPDAWIRGRTAGHVSLNTPSPPQQPQHHGGQHLNFNRATRNTVIKRVLAVVILLALLFAVSSQRQADTTTNVSTSSRLRRGDPDFDVDDDFDDASPQQRRQQQQQQRPSSSDWTTSSTSESGKTKHAGFSDDDDDFGGNDADRDVAAGVPDAEADAAADAHSVPLQPISPSASGLHHAAPSHDGWDHQHRTDDESELPQCRFISRIVKSHHDTTWRAFRKFWIIADDGVEYFYKIFPEPHLLKDVYSQLAAYYMASALGYSDEDMLVPPTYLFVIERRQDFWAYFNYNDPRRVWNQPRKWVSEQVNELHHRLHRERQPLLYGIIQAKVANVTKVSGGSGDGESFCTSLCPQCRTQVLDYFTGNYDRMKNCFVHNDKVLAIDNEGYFRLNPPVAKRAKRWYSKDVLYDLIVDAAKTHRYTEEHCRFAPHIVRAALGPRIALAVRDRFHQVIDHCTENGNDGSGSPVTGLYRLIDDAAAVIDARQQRLAVHIYHCKKAGMLNWNETAASAPVVVTWRLPDGTTTNKKPAYIDARDRHSEVPGSQFDLPLPSSSSRSGSKSKSKSEQQQQQQQKHKRQRHKRVYRKRSRKPQ